MRGRRTDEGGQHVASVAFVLSGVGGVVSGGRQQLTLSLNRGAWGGREEEGRRTEEEKGMSVHGMAWQAGCSQPAPALQAINRNWLVRRPVAARKWAANWKMERGARPPIAGLAARHALAMPLARAVRRAGHRHRHTLSLCPSRPSRRPQPNPPVPGRCVLSAGQLASGCSICGHSANLRTPSAGQRAPADMQRPPANTYLLTTRRACVLHTRQPFDTTLTHTPLPTSSPHQCSAARYRRAPLFPFLFLTRPS